MSISTNIGFIINEDQTIKFENERKNYIELGVIVNKSSLRIPALLYDDTENIAKVFNEGYLWTYYVQDEKVKKQYYIDNGVLLKPYFIRKFLIKGNNFINGSSVK